MERREVDRLAKIIWDYHHLHQELHQADIILCFTSLDLSVSEYVAKLYRQGVAPEILVRGRTPPPTYKPLIGDDRSREI